MALHPDPSLPLVFVVSGYMVYEERPALIYPNGLCVLVDLMGVPTYFQKDKWTHSRSKALSIGLAELHRQQQLGTFRGPEAHRRFRQIAEMYDREQCFLRPGWSQKDLDRGDPAPLPQKGLDLGWLPKRAAAK